MKRALTVTLMVLFISHGTAPAECPSADHTDDCVVNFEDFAFLAGQWIDVYNYTDLTELADQWLMVGTPPSSGCPSADHTDDCVVNFEDFAVLAGQWIDVYNYADLTEMADQWLTEGILDAIVWISIDDPGVDADGDGTPDHEPFNGEMSRYETTNAQYCQFLNAALASGDIIIDVDNVVFGADGSNGGADFVDEVYYDTYKATNLGSQITYSGGTFTVLSRDGYDMDNHPVVLVSWYGATAFCNYYGYRLPTEWEWQAVADYDGSYTYGCGTTIDTSKANHADANPLGLSSEPYTSPVNHYPSYGYGTNDMAGGVWEWTSTDYYTSRVRRGGGWGSSGDSCTVSKGSSSSTSPDRTYDTIGFRVCR